MVMRFGIQSTPSPGFIVQEFHRFGLDIRSFVVPLNRAISNVAIPDIEENFRTESYFASESQGPISWAAHADSTKSSGKKLYDSGTLFRHAIAKARWRVDGQAGTATAQANSPVAYANVHQFGYGKIPARPFMNLRGGAADRTSRIFEVWLAERIRDSDYRWRSRSNIDARAGAGRFLAQAGFSVPPSLRGT